MPLHRFPVRFLSLLSLLFLLGAHAASGQDGRAARAQALTEKALVEGRLPGLQAAVLVRGEIVFSAALGQCNLEHAVATTPATRMRIGSITKTFTASLLALLVEEETLDLDVPVRTYVPGFPAKSHPMTLRQLAGHLSGMPHYQPAEFVNRRHYASVTEALEKFRDRELLFPPGERFEYSSFGWNLVGAAIEGAAGKPFLELLQERVLRPLDLHDTLPDRATPLVAHRAQAYVTTSTGHLNTPAIDQSDAWPSAGLLSSAEDLVRFAHAMWQGRLVPRSTTERFATAMQTDSGESTGYGIGWQDQDLAGHRFKGHGGSHVGATADLWYQPEQGVAIALITNTNSGALAPLLERLAALYVAAAPTGD